MVDDLLKGLGADALIPIGTGNPVAYLALVVFNRQVGGGGGELADTAYDLMGLVQLDGPSEVV